MSLAWKLCNRSCGGGSAGADLRPAQPSSVAVAGVVVPGCHGSSGPRKVHCTKPVCGDHALQPVSHKRVGLRVAKQEISLVSSAPSEQRASAKLPAPKKPVRLHGRLVPCAADGHAPSESGKQTANRSRQTAVLQLTLQTVSSSHRQPSNWSWSPGLPAKHPRPDLTH